VSLIGIDHVQLAMPAGGEAAARSFYAQVLGLAEVAKPAELAARGGVWFRDGRVHLHLGVEKDFRPAKKAHPAFLVDDVAGLSAVLEAAGIGVAVDVDHLGRPRLYVDDPFGNRLELIEAPPF
jgi:catechol 2,3-dioxygenase-like lactoylglutathione lyase family enzyme